MMPDAGMVIVTWEDTTNIAAWQTPEEVAEWAGERGWICQNVGWLVYQDEHCVVIAGRRAMDHQHHLGLAERIPRRAILEMNNMAGAVIPDPGKWQCECPGGDHRVSGRGYDLTAQSDG